MSQTCSIFPWERRACACRLDRRAFLQAGILGTFGLATAPAIMAGPFDAKEYRRLIPEDKKLHLSWVAKLFARGEPEIVTDPKALEHIGMPVGGLFAGTLYLGGDGRLWLWDIFNRDQLGIVPRKVVYQGREIGNIQGTNYIQPAPRVYPLEQRFFVEWDDGQSRQRASLDAEGGWQISFRGEYPIGRVTYRHPDRPIEVTLEAFSPFIPLQVEDSSIPVTIMWFQVRNRTNKPIRVTLSGTLENAIAIDSKKEFEGTRVFRLRSFPEVTLLEAFAEPASEELRPSRPDILFEDFEKSTYEGWTVEGTAFGSGPVRQDQVPTYQGNLGGEGQRMVNSHATAPGRSVQEKDSATGRLISRPFRIQRHYITFLIGGGAHKGKTCLNLVINGKVVRSATGKNRNRMERAFFDVREFEGQTAHLEIVDQATGSWGNIGVDSIVFTDRKPRRGKLEEQRDFGTMALALMHEPNSPLPHGTAQLGASTPEARVPLSQKLIGQLARTESLGPNQTQSWRFLIAWHFPNFYAREEGNRNLGHAYAARFRDAFHVIRYVTRHFDRLAGDTRLWVQTWYDSTLPYWLLDRTMANTSTLATTTCYRRRSGRFWAWEGIGCCWGTCTHVWHYAQAPGRLFPDLTRDIRRRVDFGIGFYPDGGIAHRASLGRKAPPAVDGQCGRILGFYRDVLMSPDDSFLRELWPKVRKAIEYLIRLDGNEDGMIEGAQPNTLDAAWYGRIPSIASLYLAVLRAGQAMAERVGDHTFAERCRRIADRGARQILTLFNGEYFEQQEDPKHPNAIGIGKGCFIDQVIGQWWAHQVGLGYLFDPEKQKSALRSLWKYNFAPDVGPFRKRFKQGRWYAVEGDAGLIMCTWPRGGLRAEYRKHWQYGYFNECMTGFEWQAASHMIWEGLVLEGLAVARAIYDRYNARRRNPYNEIECSDHYARAMASYSVFLAVCGFEYDGPAGMLGFHPRLHPENFRAAFTAAEGWGTIAQTIQSQQMKATITPRWGRLRLQTLRLTLPRQKAPSIQSLECRLDTQPVTASFQRQSDQIHIQFSSPITIQAGQTLSCTLKWEP